MADKKKPNTFKGAVVALMPGGPIGNKMRRAGDTFMVSEGEFSENWMRKATKEEKAAMKPEDAAKATYDNGTVARLTGELKAMTEERDKALGDLAECQLELDGLKAGKPDTAPASEPKSMLTGDEKPPTGDGSGSKK